MAPSPGMAPSPSAGRQLYRRENDSIAMRCGVAPPPSAQGLVVERLHRHPLSHCDMAPSPSAGRVLYRCTIARSPQGEPRGEKPVGRPSRYPLDIGLYSIGLLYRVVSLVAYSTLFLTTLSVSFESMRKLWGYLKRECSISFSHGIVAVAVL
jgi:hypothetical protein